MSEDKVCCHLRYFGKCPKHGISEWVFDEQRKQIESLNNLKKIGEENLKEAWAALTMIRETIETLAPTGSVQNAEYIPGGFIQEGEALVAGIRKAWDK